MTTPYELSAEQVDQIKEWLRPWDPCPWCEAETRHWSESAPWTAHVDQPITHRADCLLALVTEETRDGYGEDSEGEYLNPDGAIPVDELPQKFPKEKVGRRGAARAPSPEHEATAAILSDHHDTRMPG